MVEGRVDREFFWGGGGGYFSREEGKNRRGRRIERKMKVHGGKELVTESPIRVHASSFPRVLLFAPTRVGARIRIPRVCIYIHARPPPIPPVARPFPRMCVRVFERVSQPTNQLPRHELLFLSLAKREAG